MSRQLPSHPHLDVLKKQARQLLNDHQSGDPEAGARVEAVLADLPPSAADSFALRHAQQVLAREYGFTSWQALLDHVGRPAAQEAPRPSPQLPVHYVKLASDLVEARRDGRALPYGCLGEDFRARMDAAAPGAAGGGDESELALEQARLALAAVSDCDSWDALAQGAAQTYTTALMDLPQLQGFERMHADLAQLLGARITSILGPDRSPQAEIAFADQTSYGEFIISQADGTRAFRLTADGLDNDLVLSLGPGLVDGLLAAVPGDRSAQLEDLADDLARDLETVWSPARKLSVGKIESYTDPFAIGAAPMYESSVLIAFEVRADAAEGEFSGLVEICYPSSAIRSAMDDLAAHALAPV